MFLEKLHLLEAVFFQKELKQQFRGVKQRSEFKTSIEQLLGSAVG